MAGVNRIISGELSQLKVRGEAFKKKLGEMFSPEAISKKKSEVDVPKRWSK